ncbi:alkaline phosphatase family protein [Desulfotomaculum nigrificans]|uniref:alkaline phosphatase family protein n=1 Tax=Desulfotomaculum nigrificans TaxID=1565 RepID=UPI0001FAE05C|nr:alkaline phosphatase family protein [Desulfotomaculum nigrificans]
MVRRKFLCFLIALFICISGAAMALAEPASTEKANKNNGPDVTSKIFIIVVDGLQDEVLQKTSAPNINGIANTGVKADKVISVFPDNAQTTVASILTGLLPENHQFVKAGSKLKGITIQQGMNDKKISTSFFGAEGAIKKLMAKGGHNCEGPFNHKDELVISNVLNEWSQAQYYFNIIVLPELRTVLQKHGVNSNEYKMAVTNTDAQIGRLFRKLHDEDSFDKSMIVITGTLGAPPLIMKGLPFKEGAQISTASICDIAPTIGYLNGVKFDKLDGLTLWTALKETPGQSESFLMNERIKDLSQANFKLQEEKYRLQEEKLLVKQQQEIVAKEKEDIQRQIAVRDQRISSLENRISLYHTIALIMLGVFLFGYVVLYRLLRKRFLMF